MPNSTTNNSARLLQVLLWYDGPQLILLERNKLEYIIAVAADFEDWKDAFLGALVSPRQLAAYQDEKFDLRYLLTHPDKRKWYVFDLSESSDNQNIKLQPTPKTSTRIPKSLPDSGFFSRAHDVIDAVALNAPDATERFEIDGSWDLGEFSKFYGQVENVYYMFNTVERVNGPDGQTALSRKQRDAFMRPFQGGGSYLGLYHDIANDNDRESKLRVSGIQYNSPGWVEVKARQEPFEQMLLLLERFSENRLQSRENYKALHGFLSKSKLLRASKTAWMSPDTKRMITVLSKRICIEFGNIDYDDIHRLSNRDQLVTAKVLLSLYRRLENLFKFFEQGRVKHERVMIDALSDI